MTPLPHTDDILERLASGEGLATICRDEGYPPESTFRYRLIDDAELAARYARARNVGLDHIAEDIMQLSDKSRVGKKTKTLPDGKVEVTTGDMVERTRLQIDARKWLLSKLRPDKYGDRTTLAGDPKAPLATAPVTLVIQSIPSPRDPHSK